MKPTIGRRKDAEPKPPKDRPAIQVSHIQVSFTLDERDHLDPAKGRVRALLTAMAYLHDYADDEVREILIGGDDVNPTGYLLEIAREYMRTIDETFDAADAREARR
jgi:hypothetical protein